MIVLIPLAGEGRRFQEAGYTFPKPLIETRGRMMIEWAIESVRCDGAKYVFLVKPGFPWASILSKLVDDFRTIEVKTKTHGAACTALLAFDFIDNDEELLIANSDQYVNWSVPEFLWKARKHKYDGGIVTFESIHPKWSYARIDRTDVGEPKVVEVAEKIPISRDATCGIYYFVSGHEFVKAAESMMEQDIRTNGEFYICPVYNEMIKEGKRILPWQAQKMYGLGTPEDLSAFNSLPSLSE